MPSLKQRKIDSLRGTARSSTFDTDQGKMPYIRTYNKLNMFLSINHTMPCARLIESQAIEGITHNLGKITKTIVVREGVIVAVIIVPPDKSRVLKIARDLSREVLMLRRLSCKYIAKLLDSGSGFGLSWMLMEYCELGDLLQLLVRKKHFSEFVVKSLAWQLIAAVRSCHAANVAHLDIKLENCFLTKKGVLRLGDFGHARVNLRNLAVCAGTKEYQAPEIIRQETFDGYSADVFSIGVCLYIMLFGRRPWQSASESDPQFSQFQRCRDLFWTSSDHMDVSDAALEVLEEMLEPVPEIRLSLSELRAKAWFRGKLLDRIDIAKYFA